MCGRVQLRGHQCNWKKWNELMEKGGFEVNPILRKERKF
jgi:hypothetical protein